MKKKPVRRHAMNIADIKVGKRHRKDHGDIASLAASMDALGLLHPVVVTLDGKLIAGARRLKAAKQLRWTEIPVRVVDLDNIVRGEFSENTERKDFTLTEAVAIKRVLEPLEKKAAKARQQQSKGRGKRVGKLPHLLSVVPPIRPPKRLVRSAAPWRRLRPSSSPPRPSPRSTASLLPIWIALVALTVSTDV